MSGLYSLQVAQASLAPGGWKVTAREASPGLRTTRVRRSQQPSGASLTDSASPSIRVGLAALASHPCVSQGRGRFSK